MFLNKHSISKIDNIESKIKQIIITTTDMLPHHQERFIRKADLLYQKITDPEQHYNCVVLKQGADCVYQSMITYIKLKNIGAKRVRGQRAGFEDLLGSDAKHYWVEAKDLIYDIHGGVTQIIKKDKYYGMTSMLNVEYAEWGMLFDDEIASSSKSLKQSLKETDDRDWLMDIANKVKVKIERENDPLDAERKRQLIKERQSNNLIDKLKEQFGENISPSDLQQIVSKLVSK